MARYCTNHCVALLALPLLLPLSFHRVDAQQVQDDTIDKLASQMRRVPPRKPLESLHEIKLRDGFHAELVAAEPLVHDPVAADFDENGRMFVVELPQYNAYALGGDAPRGSVRMLEDTDGDRRYDTSTVYVDDLDYPTAVACWDGGLFIGAAPDLLFVKDTNGDGKADTREVVLTGFGKDKAGEAHLNSFRWGLDNRFHFSTSLAGGDVRAPGDPAATPVSVRNRGIIFDPRDPAHFELTSGAGQHGMSMDDWGRKFVCSNSVPAQTLMLDDRYIARNPYTIAPAVAVDIAPEGKLTQLFRISAPEPWRALRTRLRKEGQFAGSDEGGKPFGFFTGATGVTIYRGDAWPEEFRGNLLVGDVANNLIYRAAVQAEGLHLSARRADAGAEFLASRDIWFRPVQMAGAPDGTIYVLDMYRELIEGVAFLPPEFMKYLNAAGGNDRGRIYRIAPDGFRNPAPLHLGDASTAELVALLEHRNGWHRDTAARLLYQRQDRAATAPLKKLAAASGLPQGRMTALYALDGLGTLDENTLLGALDDSAAMVRVHAVRLAESLVGDHPAVAAKLAAMTSDDDLRVRYQLALSLGSCRGAARNDALAALAARDGDDPWMRVAVLSSLFQGAGPVFRSLSENRSFRQESHGRALLVSLAAQIGAANRRDEVAAVLRSLQIIPRDEDALAQHLVEAFVANQPPDSRRMIAQGGGKTAELLTQLLDEAKTVAQDDAAAVPERVEAIRTLRLARFDAVQPLLSGLLDLRQPVEVQSAVLETLGGFAERRVPEMVIGRWAGFSPAVRARATETLLSRRRWIVAFLDAVAGGHVRRSDVDQPRARLLVEHPDRQIAKRASDLFGDTLPGPRQEVIRRYRAALEITGEAARGKEVFKRVCSACHQLEGAGTAVGADLKAIRERGMPAVLENILDPNREVKPAFLTYVALTGTGRVITGMIQTEGANSLTMRRPDGTTVELRRAEIEELSSSGLSFMPEGLEKDIDLRAMADLLAYLDAIR